MHRRAWLCIWNQHAEPPDVECIRRPGCTFVAAHDRTVHAGSVAPRALPALSNKRLYDITRKNALQDVPPSLSLARTRMLFCLWFARAWTTIPLQLRAVEHWCSMNTNTRIAVLVDDVVVVFVLNVVVVVSVLDDVFVVVVDVDSDSDDGPRPVRAHLIRYIG